MLVLAGCGKKAQPKPYGYFRIDLPDHKYIKVDNKGYITLTLKGLEEANQMYERHITIANFFKKIGVSEDVALKDACRMEHHLSDESFNAIKKLIEELDK